MIFKKKKLVSRFSFETQLNEEILTKIELNFFYKSMADQSFDKVLKNYFPKSVKSDWKKIAMLETHSKDPLEILSWRGKDEIFYLPYYDTEDSANLQFLRGFQKPAGEISSTDKHTWVHLPAVNVLDDVSANSIALNYLSNGAQGLLFDFQMVQPSDLNRLMQDIEWPYCFVAFQSFSGSSFMEHLAALIQNKFDPITVHGALFWESIPKRSNADLYFNSCKNFKALGLIIPPASPIDEISDALVGGIKMFENFASGSDDLHVFRSIAFSISSEPAIIETAAKLKALRMLWYQIAQAYGHNDYNVGDLHIHARSVNTAAGAYTPHENMLKGTFASIAAVMGGCDSLTIHCDQEPAFIPRWGRNVSAILREESFFNQAADPLAGAYAVDCIVSELARNAWERFQRKLTLR